MIVYTECTFSFLFNLFFICICVNSFANRCHLSFFQIRYIKLIPITSEQNRTKLLWLQPFISRYTANFNLRNNKYTTNPYYPL